MTWRLPRFLNGVEMFLLNGTGTEGAEALRAQLYEPPRLALVTRGGRSRPAKRRRGRPMTVAQAQQMASDAEAYDRSVSRGR